MENLIPFTLFGSGIVFGIMSLVFVILLFASDVNENGYLAFISAVIFGVGLYFWSDFEVLGIFTLESVGIYLISGFIFSIIRTYFKGRELTAEYKGKNPKHYKGEKTTLAEYKENFDLKDNVFRWWFLFPICFINWVVGHLVKDIFNFAYDKIGVMFLKIFNA